TASMGSGRIDLPRTLHKACASDIPRKVTAHCPPFRRCRARKRRRRGVGGARQAGGLGQAEPFPRGAPGGRMGEIRKIIQAPSPEMWSETISGSEEVLAGKWGALFWATSLKKISAA